MTTSDVFQTTITKSAEWVEDVMAQLGITDARKGLRVLRAGLHTIRDRLPDGEVVDLGAQIPTLLRGFYYDGWRPGAARERPRDEGEVLEEMRDNLDRDATIDPELGLRAVIRVLAWHVSGGELDDVEHTLPTPLARIWADACA
jgi:uncharacterized protein (DUF2267 family)